MPDLGSAFVENAVAWTRWRASKKTSVLGWIGVFAGQGLVAAILFGVVLFLIGAPVNAATLYVWFFFSIGCALSGVVFGALWAFLFLNLTGIILGLSLGVWFNSPSWWGMAAAEWNNGASIPHLVVIFGLVLPPLWSLSCIIAHRGWIKVIDMVFSKVLATLAGRPSEADRRKAAAKDLKVSDAEADRALRENENEPEGLTVIERSKVVREEQTSEEELEGESLYGSLAVDGNDEELSGLSESAAKSKQIVDASGAVVSADSAPVNPEPNKPAFSTDLSSPFESDKKEESAAAATPTPVSKVDLDRLRGEDKNRLTFLCDEYNVMMTQSSDEQEALVDFMERHSSNLMSLSDQEISFLKGLPDGSGRGLAETALQVQMRASTTETSFESAVEAGTNFDEITERPTAHFEAEDDDIELDEGHLSAAESIIAEGSSDDDFVVDDEDEEFVPDFSFSGDEASKVSSGRRVASLLAQGAFGQAGGSSGSDRETGFSSDDGENEGSSPNRPVSDDIVIEDEPESDSVVGGDSSHNAPFDSIARKLELVTSGKSFEEAEEIVRKEIAAINSEKSEEAAAVSGSDLSDDVDDEANEEEDEIFGFALDMKDNDSKSKEALKAQGNEEDAEAESEALSAAVTESEETVVSDNTVSDQKQGIDEMSIEAPVSEAQALAIFRIMTSDKLEPKQKYDQLVELEGEQDNVKTITAYRSKAFIEHLGEKTAHDIKNNIIALFRDFKDAEAEKFGELASEAEAKIADLRQFPHKLERSKIDDLRHSAELMDDLLRGNMSTVAMERKIRLSRIQGGIDELEELLASQSAPVENKSLPATPENRKKAESMIKRLSGAEVSVSTSNDGENEDEDEGEEVDMVAAAADEESFGSGPYAEKPWLDPELGDLDEEFSIIPEGININTPEGIKAIQDRTALQSRRIEAKRLRDEFLEKESVNQAEAEKTKEENLALQQRASHVAQLEETLKEREAEMERREREAAERRTLEEEELRKAKDELAEARQKVAEQENVLGERGKTLDRLSDVLKGDTDKKVEMVRFISANMSGLFSVRDVPVRFAQVNDMFNDLVLARAIQKRVKGSSVGLQDALVSEGGEDLPERVFPNKLNMTFHGATVFRKSVEILHKIATEIEVEIAVPNSPEEEIDIQPLLDACADEDEKAFLSEIVGWMKPSRAEFFEMTKALEENAHDYRLARKIESSNMEDVEALGAANANLKRELETRTEELEQTKAALKEAEQKLLVSRPRSPDEKVEGFIDSGTIAIEIDEMFTEASFPRSRGKALREVGQRKVAIGLLDGGLGLPSKNKLMRELEAGSLVPVVIFTDAPEEEREFISSHFNEVAQIAVSFESLDVETAKKFMLEEIRKIDDE